MSIFSPTAFRKYVFANTSCTFEHVSENVRLNHNAPQAIAEDPDFDKEVEKFVSHIINLLDGKKDCGGKRIFVEPKLINENGICPSLHEQQSDCSATSVRWNINELFGCFFLDSKEEAKASRDDPEHHVHRNM